MNKTRFTHKFLGYNDDLNRKEYTCDIYGLQHDCWKRVGYCKYYSIDLDDQIVYIEFINISESHRRVGYGTDMVKELRKLYTLYWDYKFTSGGRKWYESLIERKII